MSEYPESEKFRSGDLINEPGDCAEFTHEVIDSTVNEEWSEVFYSEIPSHTSIAKTLMNEHGAGGWLGDQ